MESKSESDRNELSNDRDDEEQDSLDNDVWWNSNADDSNSGNKNSDDAMDDSDNNPLNDLATRNLPLYEGSEITVLQAVIMVLRMYLYNKVSYKSVNSALEMVSLFLPNTNRMPPSMFRLNKFIFLYLPKVNILILYHHTTYYQ